MNDQTISNNTETSIIESLIYNIHHMATTLNELCFTRTSIDPQSWADEYYDLARSSVALIATTAAIVSRALSDGSAKIVAQEE